MMSIMGATGAVVTLMTAKNATGNDLAIARPSRLTGSLDSLP